MLENWVVVPTCLPTVLRRCHACPSRRFRTSGKFRVNAHHKLIDAWLLALCATCGETAKVTVLERMNVRSVRPELLDRLHGNDPGLAAELLQDPVVRRRSRIALDWDNAWRLDTGGSDHLDRGRGLPCPGEAGSSGKTDVSVRFAARVPVRPVRLIAKGCGLSRAGAERLITEGRIVSAVRLSGRLSGDFTFTLKL
ncbi:hypothetical protein AR457_13500 [Streptomyces agglomeratus]|uniref:DUF1062 domain-containing protein n=1 Tax=Streptomyces agglomeratus TaxID=285458 RepID=UPI000854AF08|nr:DUF1062 domain-containing protein [Streptomyces agglomeratus]OEJ40639.1 hypothetical protein BGK70_23150 [Streptomyces agglomeratus]OEJ44981.1 hypothetical protein AR457_13500 [Streptomyces agglomeratus]